MSYDLTLYPDPVANAPGPYFAIAAFLYRMHSLFNIELLDVSYSLYPAGQQISAKRTVQLRINASEPCETHQRHCNHKTNGLGYFRSIQWQTFAIYVSFIIKIPFWFNMKIYISIYVYRWCAATVPSFSFEEQNNTHHQYLSLVIATRIIHKLLWEFPFYSYTWLPPLPNTAQTNNLHITNHPVISLRELSDLRSEIIPQRSPLE